MKNKKGVKKNISIDGIYIARTLMLAVCVIFILLLVYIVGGLFLVRENIVGPDNSSYQKDAYFSGCVLLEENCLDGDCNFYTLCGDGNYKVCKVYDCGDSHGVFTEDVDGAVDRKKRNKPDLKALDAKKEACQGSLAILEDKCIQGEEENLKVKIVTEGECTITAFTLIYDIYGARATTFEDLGGGEYMILSDYCGVVSEIVPATGEGISLELEYLNN
ncbi:MAG: hypothetical protein PHI66_01915 [Candidatus Pacebacteria bacterium]|nr:hypothetical protein [Candidatus Paceibacterota bacterium]